MSGADQVRQQFFLARDESDRLEAMARKAGVPKSRLLAQAWRSWVKRGAADELEHKFAQRLDRISAQLSRVERNGHIGIESHSLFVRYMLMVTPPLADDDEAGKALGRQRFVAFVHRVARRLVTGRRSFVTEDEEA